MSNDDGTPKHSLQAVALPPAIRGSYECSSSQKLYDEPNTYLAGLSTVNVIAGPNNSGKSRLLRALFADLFSGDEQGSAVHRDLPLGKLRDALEPDLDALLHSNLFEDSFRGKEPVDTHLQRILSTPGWVILPVAFIQVRSIGI